MSEKGDAAARRVHDAALRRLRDSPDLDELAYAARDLAYLTSYSKPRKLRLELLEAFGAIDDTHPQRQAAELTIKREFGEVAAKLEKVGAVRAREAAREDRRADMLEYQKDLAWARLEAKRPEDGDSTAPDTYVDIAKVLAGDMTTLTPSAGGIRSDLARMLYGGKVNGLVGESEAGKTLIATAMSAHELSRGGSVGWIDVDHNGAVATLGRFLAAGVSVEVLVDESRFRLCVPEDRGGVCAAVSDAASWRPTMVVVDSVGEIVPMYGGDSNSADDYSRVHREVFALLAASGAAVLVIDHLAKTALGTGYASGTGAKKRAMDGAYYGVSVVQPFRPGVGGAAALTILKDRHGGVRAMTSGKTAAVFNLDSRVDQWSWDFYPGKSDDDRASDRFEQDVATVIALKPFPTSRTALQAALRERSGKGWNAAHAREVLAEANTRRAATFPI